MSVFASGPFLDWEDITGLSKFWVDLISVPIFSAIAGVLTNWTGVLMMFVPVEFHGRWCPGLNTLFPFFHPKVQVLPCWAPNGIIGFQGIIPSRSEKVGSMIVDLAISRIGSMRDFFQELEPDVIAAQVAELAKPKIRPLVSQIMKREHPDLWRDLPKPLREVVFQRIEAELPAISRRSFERIGDGIEHLIDVKLFVVGYLRTNPNVMKDLVEGLGGPELRLMVRIGLLGFPFGIVLALYLQIHHHIPIWGQYVSPVWMVLFGAAAIGVIVNFLAIKIVFTPGDPQPRYKVLWKQASFAKRQNEAAGDLGHALAYMILTLDNISNELLNGPRADRMMGLVDRVVSEELDRILGPLKNVVRTAVGAKEFDAVMRSAPTSAIELTPQLLADKDFARAQSAKIDQFATGQLRAMPPATFMELLYSMVEQDAWLLYVHGGLMGIIVGCVHLLIFGA